MGARLLAATALIGWGAAAEATGLDIYLSSETAQIGFVTDSSAIGFGGADVGLGVFFNDDSDWMLSGSMTVSGVPAGEHPVTFGVGGKLYIGAVDDPDQNFQALALGGSVRHTIPANMPLTLGAEAFYAPGVTTFGDASDLFDLVLRFEVEVTPGAAGYIGYRRLELDLDEKKNYKLDNNVHFGVRFSF